MIRVLVADDHTLFREGLKRVLTEATGIVVAGEAAHGADVLARLRESAFDVALLDINMPHRSGLEALGQIRKLWPQLPVIMLSMYPEEQYAMEAFRAGAAGYLTKGAGSEELVTAIRKVAAGGRHASPQLAEKLMERLDGATTAPLHHQLSAREYQIFDLVVDGKTLTDIAEQLHLSVSTVSTYRGRVLEKMKMHTNAELITYAIKNRLRD